MIDIGPRGQVEGLRFLARFVPERGLSREKFLKIVKSLSDNLGASARNAKWTSYGALEIDIFARSAPDFETLVATIEPMANVEFTKNLDEPQKHMEKDEAINLSRFYFNQERFWESHETLESVWRIASGVEKRWLQGLILVDAAFVHLQKGEASVALGILQRARGQLEWKGKKYHGIDVEKIRKRVEKMIRNKELEIFMV